MPNNRILPALAFTLCLAGCGVPEVEDPQNIVVDGQAMSARAFLDKYCAGKMDDKTCQKVMRANRGKLRNE